MGTVSSTNKKDIVESIDHFEPFFQSAPTDIYKGVRLGMHLYYFKDEETWELSEVCFVNSDDSSKIRVCFIESSNIMSEVFIDLNYDLDIIAPVGLLTYNQINNGSRLTIDQIQSTYDYLTDNFPDNLSDDDEIMDVLQTDPPIFCRARVPSSKKQVDTYLERNTFAGPPDDEEIMDVLQTDPPIFCRTRVPSSKKQVDTYLERNTFAAESKSLQQEQTDIAEHLLRNMSFAQDYQHDDSGSDYSEQDYDQFNASKNSTDQFPALPTVPKTTVVRFFENSTVEPMQRRNTSDSNTNVNMNSNANSNNSKTVQITTAPTTKKINISGQPPARIPNAPANPAGFKNSDGQWVLREDSKLPKSFCYYVCSNKKKCGKKWVSAHGFRDFKQGCKKCETMSLPTYMWLNYHKKATTDQTERDMSEDKPHDCARCEACKLGLVH